VQPFRAARRRLTDLKVCAAPATPITVVLNWADALKK
jgi:hypothetical protein